jgi:hypothetical protein
MLDVLRRALHLTPPADLPTRQRLKQLRGAAYDLIADTPFLRETDREFWRGRGAQLWGPLAQTDHPAQAALRTAEWVAESQALWRARQITLSKTQGVAAHGPLPTPTGSTPLPTALGWLAFAMADVIASAAPTIRAVAQAACGAYRREERDNAADLLAYVNYLVPQPVGGREGVLLRLLAMEVVQYAVGSYRNVPDQFVELVQISANVRTAFGGLSSAREKLAGAQMGNFGAFYKKSWRANDWMFGRLDGAERLLRILLNPSRLLRLYGGRASCAQVADLLERIAVPPGLDPASRAFLLEDWQKDRPLVEQDLGFLEHPDWPVPEELPHAIRGILRRLHLELVRDELPAVVGAIEDDQRQGGGSTGLGADFAAAARRMLRQYSGAWPMVPAKELVSLFGQCRIGSERLPQEVRTDLFTRTLTRLLAVAVSAFSNANAGMGPARGLLQTMRLPVLLLDVLAQSLLAQSRTGAAVFAAVFAASAVLVALTLMSAAVLPAWLATLAALAFVASVAVPLIRHPRLLLLWLLLAGAVWLVSGHWPTFCKGDGLHV